ncbi:ankyrin repeat domain-containing protein [Kineosporia succinea]|uniref:Ankyrin repeat protein n=1 Tax=Kineosporia succinea TaxID=84632 RepID=A0ABT9P293_9ACTN|nr:ankyrin repeat domain-containing protein [Kineosporia succinea]MDP9826773.1 ankyrin repeat protein [Kineosporia succinea]
MNRRKRKKLQGRLFEAAAWGSPGQVRRLLRAGADPDVRGEGGSTPLYRASLGNRSENVRVLLAAGADPNLESGPGDEGLPLCGAASHGHDAVVKELLTAGADPWLREDGGTGFTAVRWATDGEQHSTLDLLLGSAPKGH